jgi:hypothetical protein
VRDRRAEDGHDRVADELLERPSVALELRAHQLELWPDRRPDVFRVTAVAETGRVDQIGEEHRHDLALLAATAVDSRPTRGAESGAFGQLGAALAARGHAARIGRRGPRY